MNLQTLAIRKRKILVADDDEGIRYLISSPPTPGQRATGSLMSSTEGHTVQTLILSIENSLFQHEAPFPSARLSASAPQPNASKEVQEVQNRILIADDDALVRGSLAAVLECEGFAVYEAQNGIEAVTRAVEYTPDLILLDLNMPRWDGWTAFSKLDRATPLVPVIVITARPNQYPKAVELGVDAFMEKPLNIPILVRAIKRLASEEENRHVRRITNRAFVTQLLGNMGS